MRVRAHVFVSGEVQGVFFRSRTRQEARTHDVTGWVKNTPDGKVEAVFEGEDEAVSALVEFCKRGPQGALVSNVDVKWEKYEGDFDDFEIAYAYC